MKTVCLILCWLAASTATPVLLYDNDTLVAELRQLLGDLLHTANESLSSAYSLPDVDEQLTKESDGWLSLRHGYLGNLRNMSRDGDSVVRMEGHVARVTAYVYFQELPFSYTIVADSKTYSNVTGHVQGELCSISGKIEVRADLKNTSAVTATVETFHLESPTAFMMRTNYTKQPGNGFAFDMSTAVHEMLKTETTQYLQHQIGKVIKKAVTQMIFSMSTVPSTTTSLPQTGSSSSTVAASKGTTITSQSTSKPTSPSTVVASKGTTITSQGTSKPTSPSTVVASKGTTITSQGTSKPTSPSTVVASKGTTITSQGTSKPTNYTGAGVKSTHTSPISSKSSSSSSFHPSNGGTIKSTTGQSTSPNTVHPSNEGTLISMTPGNSTNSIIVHQINESTFNSETPGKSTNSNTESLSIEIVENSPNRNKSLISNKEQIAATTTQRKGVIAIPVSATHTSSTKSKHFPAHVSGKENIFYGIDVRNNRFANDISPSDNNYLQSLRKEVSPYIIITVNPGAGSEYPPHNTIHCDVTISNLPYSNRGKTSSNVGFAQKDWLTENFNGFFDTLIHEAGRQLTRQNSEFLELPDDEEELYQFQDGSISLEEGDVYGLEHIILGEDLKVERYDNLANVTVDVDFFNVTYSFKFSARSKTSSNNTLINGTVSGNMTGLQGHLCILANLTNSSAVRAVLENFQLLPTTELPMDVQFFSSSAKNMTEEIADAVARDFRKDVVHRVEDHVTRKLRSAIGKLHENVSPTTTTAKPSAAAPLRTSCVYFLITIVHASTMLFFIVP